jgi:hypothetical protein
MDKVLWFIRVMCEGLGIDDVGGYKGWGYTS